MNDIMFVMQIELRAINMINAFNLISAIHPADPHHC